MLNKSQVIFNEIDHTYFLDGLQLSGVTSLLHRQLFRDKYNGIDSEILKKAAEYGSRIHQLIELHDSLGVENDNDTIKFYEDTKQRNGLKTLVNEYLVSDNRHIASSIDIVFDDFSLCDIKTTSSLDREYVSWQLSVYAYLFEMQNPELKCNRLYALWLPKLRYGKPALVEVERKPNEWIEALIEADRKGEQYALPAAATTEALIVSPDVVDEIIAIDMQAKELADRRKQLQQGLLELMKVNNVKSFKTDGLQLIYKAPSTRISVDTKRLQERYPDIYTECLVEAQVKESLTIKTA